METLRTTTTTGLLRYPQWSNNGAYRLGVTKCCLIGPKAPSIVGDSCLVL